MRGPIDDGRCQLERQEYYGLIDGVCPIEYPHAYYVLNISKCFKRINEGEPIYVENRYPWRRMCDRCHRGWGHWSLNFLRRVRWHSLCSPMEGLPLQLKLECAICKKEIMKWSQARECRECIEQYLLTRAGFEVERFMERNFEVEVNVRIY